MGSIKPLKKVLTYKKRLYGAHLNEKGETKLFPYLMCSFSNPDEIKSLSYRLRKSVNITGYGYIVLKIHEIDANPILQMTCNRDIPTAGWIQFKGNLIDKDEQITLCHSEYKVKWKYLEKSDCNVIPRPKIMGFDIEVNSHRPSMFPDAKEPEDKVFQISCVICREGDDPSVYEKYLLTLGNPDQNVTGNDINISTFKTEYNLLEGFSKFIREHSVNVIVGYNILGFDIPYLIDRSKHNFCINEFSLQGFHKFKYAKEKTIKWSSSAYKNQEFQYLDAEGRLYVDLLPLVKRDFKMNNYKLKTVSDYFLGETKDPLSPEGIFKCYKLGMEKDENDMYTYNAKKAMAICGKYCVQDSALVVKLMDKLKIWVGLTEMAKTCNVPIFSLYTQGQQIKVFSQVYKYCLDNHIVVEKDGYTVNENERYVGAHVFPPVPGKYHKVVPFDFASLYPTTIIAYNIDYNTFVTDPNIPDHKCHIMEWNDCIGCCHDPKVIRKSELSDYIESQQDKISKLRQKRNSTKVISEKTRLKIQIDDLLKQLKPYTDERAEINKTKPKFPMCAKRSYRFLKEPPGVLPTVIQNLLDARKHTRKVDMKQCKEMIKKLEESLNDLSKNDQEISEINKQIREQKSLLDILDKRQLAYKVSCNSMYGAMGVKRGYLPFMPGAMCTTYMGRVNIEKVAKIIPEKYKGQLIYGDTDSNYIHFPHLKTAQETWDYALYVADELTKIFPKPIKLEFEEEIYDFFFILTKKRYMYRKCLRDGKVDNKIGKKGVLLARRDNSKFVREIYENVISKIADNEDKENILYYIVDQLNNLCSSNRNINDFVVTKAVGDIGDFTPKKFIDEKGVTKCKIGDYTVPMLPSRNNIEEYNKELKKKNANTSKEFYMSCLPAQVQLAERMRTRGERVDKGSRLEYIVTDPDNHTAKQYEKVESADYVKKFPDIIKVDYLYYIKALSNPIDQVLSVAFNDIQNFVLNQYNFRYKLRYKMLCDIKNISKPNIVIN